MDTCSCEHLWYKGNTNFPERKKIRRKHMANKRFNKQVPGFGFIKGKPEKGTEAVKGNVSPQEKKNIAFSKSRKIKNTAS
jgi:hypothetical protein